MLKRFLLCLFAAAQFIFANLNISYTVSVNGSELPGSYSGSQIRRCQYVSQKTVDEICRTDSVIGDMETISAHLAVCPPSGKNRMLCDALICSSPGVSRYCTIYIDNTRIGTVSDPEIIDNIGCATFRPVYSFTGRLSDDSCVVNCIYGNQREIPG